MDEFYSKNLYYISFYSIFCRSRRDLTEAVFFCQIIILWAVLLKRLKKLIFLSNHHGNILVIYLNTYVCFLPALRNRVAFYGHPICLMDTFD